MKSRIATVLVVLVGLLQLSLPALASSTQYTNPITYGHATYNTNDNKFTLYDDECDGNYNYVNYAFNNTGAIPGTYSTHQAGVGCGSSEWWTVNPTASLVVYRVCVYNTFGPDHCGSWGSTDA
ncbi:MAG TPA: hypothetical protein VJA46_13075 [Acidimicrobiia bacterium]|nr:hypothetical protein [Acidimicrobiia bacterium]